MTLEKGTDMCLSTLRSHIGTVRHHRQLFFDFAGLWPPANGAGGANLIGQVEANRMNMSY
jgi:hypothetical protein